MCHVVFQGVFCAIHLYNILNKRSSSRLDNPDYWARRIGRGDRLLALSPPHLFFQPGLLQTCFFAAQRVSPPSSVRPPNPFFPPRCPSMMCYCSVGGTAVALLAVSFFVGGAAGLPDLRSLHSGV